MASALENLANRYGCDAVLDDRTGQYIMIKRICPCQELVVGTSPLFHLSQKFLSAVGLEGVANQFAQLGMSPVV